MAYWLEIICDVRRSGRNEFGENTCFSAKNANPGGLSGNLASERAASFRVIASEARQGGWRKTRAGWVCPAGARTAAAETEAKPR